MTYCAWKKGECETMTEDKYELIDKICKNFEIEWDERITIEVVADKFRQQIAKEIFEELDKYRTCVVTNCPRCKRFEELKKKYFEEFSLEEHDKRCAFCQYSKAEGEAQKE